MEINNRYSCYYKLSIEIKDKGYQLVLIPLDCIRDFSLKKVEINIKIAQLYKHEFERIDNELYNIISNKKVIENKQL